MCKYYKIKKLSAFLKPFKAAQSDLTGLIAVISLASLMFNFVFPHIALANNNSRNSVLSFNYSEITAILPSVAENAGKGAESNKTLTLPVEPAKEVTGAKEIIINLTLAKKVAENAAIDVSGGNNDILAEKICRDLGITDLPCWQDLKAMREKESYDGKVMVGDGGRSRGWYHIQIKMHRISHECALDFECSTEWTVRNLIANGYKTNRFYAISRHNGGGAMAQKYAKSVINDSAKH